MTAEVVDGALRVTMEGDAAFPEGSEATARVTGPDLTATEVRLERVDSTTFAGEVPADQAGSYAVASTVTDETGVQLAGGTALTNLSYGAEYEPGEPDAALLARVSDATGGRGEIGADLVFDPDDLEAGRSRVPLAGWLLLAAALVWPVAVAVSRLSLSGAGARSLAAARSSSRAWLRTRAPGLPGRAPARPGSGAGAATRAGRGPAPGSESTDEEGGDGGAAVARPPDPAGAPSESLGALLASQRRRRGIDGGDDEPG